MATIEDFQKLDIRTGIIVQAWDFPEAKKPSLKLEIDFGDLGMRKSSAQITDFYSPETLIGKNIIAIVNFPPRQIGKFVSEVLVLGALDADGRVILLHTDQKTPAGLKIA